MNVSCVENDMFTLDFMREGMKRFGSFVEELLESCWKVCEKDTEVIIQNPPCMEL